MNLDSFFVSSRRGPVRNLSGDIMSENMSEKTNDKLKEKQPLPWWRRISLGLVLTAIVLLTVSMPVSYLAGRQLGAEIVKVSQAGEPLTFADLQAELEPSSTGEDAARYYAEALQSIGQKDLTNLARINATYREDIISTPADQLPDEMREKITQTLATFQPALEKFDKGTDIPLSRFDIGLEQGVEVCITGLNRVRTAVSLLSLRTLDLILRGQGDAAVNSVISTLQIMRIFDSHPTMVVQTVKVGCAGLTCDDIHLLLERGRPSEESLAKLQKVLSQTIPANVLERMFLAERVYQMEIARNLIPEKIASQLLDDNVPDLPERSSLPSSYWARLRMRQKLVRRFQDMTGLITTARRPWPEPLDEIIGNALEPAGKPGRLLPRASLLVHLTAGTLAATRCAMLTVVIERYRRSHGELPGSLDDIAPPDIDAIPSDPFTGNKLLYSHDEEGYVVYSTGINRQDDSGSVEPKADEKSPLDWGFRIHFRKPE